MREDADRLVVERDAATRPLVLGVAPRGAWLTATRLSSIRNVFAVGVDVVPAECEHLAAAEPVEDPEAESDRPAVVAGRPRGTGDLGGVPRFDLLHLGRLGHGSGERDPGGRAAGDQSLVDGVGERGPQHGAADLHAPPGQLPAGGERFDPLGDVLAVETGDRDRAEPGLDVRDRPRVLSRAFSVMSVRPAT